MFSKRLNSKVLVSLVILLMTVVVSAFAGLKSESWSLNPADFRYDMSLYFRMENKVFEDLSAYEIGAFVEDECRGLAEKIELTQDESCLYMRIRSNIAEGEKLSFYMKDKKTGQIVVVKGEDGSELTFKANSRIGMPSSPFVMSPFYTATFKIDGEVVETLTIGYGDPIVAPEVPEKEGYTFNGWGDLPATMPAYDIEVHSTYTVNLYTLTFLLDEENFYSTELTYGSSIIVPEAPEKEGLKFLGWGEVPETMPAHDLVIKGAYEKIIYNVIYKIDGEVFHMSQVNYGSPIPALDVTPEKIGYTFGGWSEIPETMPAHDVEINGFFEINHYTITFRLDNEDFVSQELAYGEEIIVPDAPAKEGYTFSGWGDVPAVMPANDLEFNGNYSVNTYSVVFRINQEVFQTQQLEYGAPIVVPVAPDLEGRSFSGWGDVPATMPAYDLVFVGTYAENYYTITFKIGDEIIKMADLAYGSEIILPEVPEKEGHTFNGWGEVPATMPASNVEVVGNYTVNNYLVTFRIDDDIIFSGELPYGSEITTPEAPAKEGYSFSGWGIVPATVPAYDIVISGTYNVNIYALTFLIDGEVYYSTKIPYGSIIEVPDAPTKEGHTLVGWTDVPASMPAYDLNIDATYSVNSYMISFKIDDDVIYSGQLPYGSEILVPEAPFKVGYTFTGWGMVPSSMPAYDLEISGTYEVNLYNLTFMVDDEVILSTTLAYGSEIIPPFLSDKEGHTFSGWGDIPSVMPANDLVIRGTYALNYYTLAFKIGEEIVSTGEVPYGAEIVAPEAPVLEGHTFSGWGDVPATMPARNLEFIGTYNVNSYSLTFMIGDDVIYDEKVLYGSNIVVPQVAEKEGYTFSGWGVVPATMPAQDLLFTASYDVNSYSIIFKIGDEVIYSAQLPYGSSITVPAVPERDGHTFSGWGNVPETMPAKNLEFVGNYNVNSYKIVFKIDDEIVLESELSYGAEIILPEVPEKEGYTFSGWGVVPATMPASDLEFSGTYEVNYYNVTFMVNDDVIYSSLLPYGSEIVAPDMSSYEGFLRWSDYPATVPAHDVIVTAILDGFTSVDVVGNVTDGVTVATLEGFIILKNAKSSEINNLTPGLYIINGKKVMVKASR